MTSEADQNAANRWHSATGPPAELAPDENLPELGPAELGPDGLGLDDLPPDPLPDELHVALADGDRALNTDGDLRASRREFRARLPAGRAGR